jgi:hypothetical protein
MVLTTGAINLNKAGDPNYRDYFFTTSISIPRTISPFDSRLSKQAWTTQKRRIHLTAKSHVTSAPIPEKNIIWSIKNHLTKQTYIIHSTERAHMKKNQGICRRDIITASSVLS